MFSSRQVILRNLSALMVTILASAGLDLSAQSDGSDRGASASIAGRLVRKDGSAVSGAHVAAFRNPFAPDADLEGKLTAMVALESIASAKPLTARSEKDGSYRIDGLDPGWYTVRAVADYLSPAINGAVRAPAEGIDLVLAPGTRFTGTVRDVAGRPVDGATVEAYAEPEKAGVFELIMARVKTPLESAVADASGRFVFRRLGSGLYNFRVEAPKFQDHQAARVEVKAGGRLELRIEPGKVLRGIVKGPDGRPLPGAKVHLRRMGNKKNPTRHPVRITFDDTPVITDARGAFVFDTLADADYALVVSHEHFASVARQGVRPSREDLVLRLRSGGRIRGKVFDSLTRRPIRGAVISVTDIADQSKEAVTDEEGSYLVVGLQSGRALEIRASAKGYARAKDSVRVAEGQMLEVDLPLEPAATVVGRIVDANGRAIGGARVEIRLRQEASAMEKIVGVGTSDGNGRFIVGGVEPKEDLRVRVVKSAYLEYSHPVSAEAGERVDIGRIRLEPEG